VTQSVSVAAPQLWLLVHCVSHWSLQYDVQLKVPGFVLHSVPQAVVQVVVGVSVQLLAHESTYWTLQLIELAVQFAEQPVLYS